MPTWKEWHRNLFNLWRSTFQVWRDAVSLRYRVCVEITVLARERKPSLTWFSYWRKRYLVKCRESLGQTSMLFLNSLRRLHLGYMAIHGCTLIATGDRNTGPSCWGSPARTNCPPPGVSVLNMPARGTKHSGCREWPASSMNTWVKCRSGISPDTSLKKHT